MRRTAALLALAALPVGGARRVLRAAGERAWSGAGSWPDGVVRPRRASSRCWRGRACTGCCGSRCGRRAVRHRDQRRARAAGGLRAAPAALPRARAGAGAAAGAVRAADGRGRRGVPPAAARRRSARRARPRRHPGGHRHRAGVLQRRGGDPHRRRDVGGPRPPSRRGRRRPRRRPGDGVPHRDAAGAATGDRVGGQRGVPVLRHGVRRRAHPGRLALRLGRDRDLPAHHQPARPARRGRALGAPAASWWSGCWSWPAAPGVRRTAAWPARPPPPSPYAAATCPRSPSPSRCWSAVATPVVDAGGRVPAPRRARWTLRQLPRARRARRRPPATPRSSCPSPRPWSTACASPSTPPGCRCCSAALVAVVVTRRSRGRAERRLRGVLDGFFMLPLGVSAVTLGFGFLITLDSPPLDLRELAAAGAARPGPGGPAARRPHPGAGARRHRRPAAPGGGLAGRRAAARLRHRRPAGRVATAARRRRASRSPCRWASSARRRSWCATRRRRCRW